MGFNAQVPLLFPNTELSADFLSGEANVRLQISLRPGGEIGAKRMWRVDVEVGCLESLSQGIQLCRRQRDAQEALAIQQLPKLDATKRRIGRAVGIFWDAVTQQESA